MSSREHRFPADHPAAPGHFPGDPIIPGALLLGEVLQCVESALGAPAAPWRIRSAKFLAPVRPGDRLYTDCSQQAPDGSVRFRCVVGTLEVLRGEVACGDSSRRG